MLEKNLRALFTKYNGVVKCVTLRRSNVITFTLTEDGKGFVCDRGPAIYLFNTMDALEKDIKIVAKHSPEGKVYYGANEARNGLRLGENPWFENTLDAMINRVCFDKNDGDSVFAASTFIAALLHKVGFATMYSKDSIDAYIKLNVKL